MAYGAKYVLKWKAINRHGFITIYEKDYTGSSDTSLKLVKGTLSITRDFSDWSQHILGATCEFDILNDKDDFFELFDLMLATEKKYLINVSDFTSTTVLFNGYINLEATQQKYLHFQQIKIVASGYLSKLEYTKLPLLDNLKAYSFIDIIDACLRTVDAEFYNIRVNMEGFPIGVTLNPGQTALNKTGVPTELFWENNVDKTNTIDVLIEILKTFRLYLYWWNGYWYLEEHFKMWFWGTGSDKEYVEYQTGVSYGVNDAGTVVPFTEAFISISDVKFISMSQTIKTVPGNKQNSIRLQEKLWESLFSPDFKGEIIDHSTPLASPTVEVRNWLQFWHSGEYTWENVNLPYLSIEKSKRRIVDPSVDLTDTSKYVRGTYFGMCFTVIDDEEQLLTINWKWNDEDFLINTDTVNAWATILRFRIYLKIIIPNGVPNFPAGTYYLKETDGSMIPGINGKIWVLTSSYENNPIDFDLASNKSEWEAGSYVWEINKNIPVKYIFYNDGSTLWHLPQGTYRITVGILTASYVYVNNWDVTPPFINMGDVKVAATKTEIENLYEGQINTDFLNTAEKDIKIFDLPDCNFGNGILMEGSNDPVVELNTYTRKWSHTDGFYNPSLGVVIVDEIQMLSLVQMIRETNITRQVIFGKILETSFLLKPLNIFYDPLQGDKLFVLMGIRYYLDSGEIDIDLREYDNTTRVELDMS